ncbi:MAG: hypothetical protein ACU0FH_05305 [Heliomarina sp.]|uniref:hypothetical protein n=1 Tax=Heliomarina sp. TaxID=2917556 RepID=UPI0040590928
MLRLMTLLCALTMISACATTTPLANEPLADLGAFRLGHNVVIADKARTGPVSRAATGDEWVDVLRPAVARRFGRYEGNQLYHFGISVEGFMLAPPGVPLIYSPKSALIINVTVWDDAANAKLNPEVKQFTVLETTTGGSFLVGSGHQRSKEEQMQGLAENAVRQIEDWMVEMKAERGWFEPRAGAATSATVPRDELVPQSEGVVPPTVPAVQG